MATIVFVPYSPRSFAGIVSDVRTLIGDCEVLALCLEGETPPDTYRHVSVSRNGDAALFAHDPGDRLLVVANGGPTPLGVAAVLLSQRFRCPLINVQRDGIVRMATD